MTENAVVAQAEKAIKALLKHEATKAKDADSGAKNLFADEEAGPSSAVWLVFGLDKIPEAKKVKPVRLTVQHPWKEAEDESLSVCLITKDPHADFKETITPLGLKSISKILGVSKLRTDYKPFEVRRQLCNAYDFFLADDRVLPLLPKLLGKTFFEKKKMPVPVDLTSKKPENIKKELKDAIESTSLHLVSGPCTSVKVGLSNQSAADLKGNVSSVIEQVVKKVPGGWKNIRTIHLKTATSISLPIYAPTQ